MNEPIGEMKLDTLLSHLSPILHPDHLVFTTVADRELALFLASTLPAQMLFVEAEGTTLIASKEAMQAAGLSHSFECRMITLNIHSSLEAVGFIAHIAHALANEGIGVNSVAGFYHDHLFIKEDQAEDAMKVLLSVSKA